MSEEKKNELSTQSNYAMVQSLGFLGDELDDDLAGLDFSLDRIKLPSGGMTAFEVPTGDGEETTLEKEIVGVILYNHPAYAYYQDAYTGGSNPPDCGSFDGVCGVGTPGGACKTCPYNQYGSAAEGKGKACKNRRMLYILRENEIFPMMLNLPTGSLRAFTKYVQSLLTRGKKPNQVVTKISLKKASNAGGIDFSQAVFKVVRALDDQEKENMTILAGQMKEFAGNLTTAVLAEDDTPAQVVDPETGEIIESLKKQ